jgi:hypothetical protein
MPHVCGEVYGHVCAQVKPNPRVFHTYLPLFGRMWTTLLRLSQLRITIATQRVQIRCHDMQTKKPPVGAGGFRR